MVRPHIQHHWFCAGFYSCHSLQCSPVHENLELDRVDANQTQVIVSAKKGSSGQYKNCAYRVRLERRWQPRDFGWCLFLLHFFNYYMELEMHRIEVQEFFHQTRQSKEGWRLKYQGCLHSIFDKRSIKLYSLRQATLCLRLQLTFFTLYHHSVLVVESSNYHPLLRLAVAVFYLRGLADWL